MTDFSQTPVCRICSTRSTVITIPADEWEDHLETHRRTPDSWPWERVRWLLSQEPEPTAERARTITVRVGAGDRAWNPATTRSSIFGPAVVSYVEYADGGYRASVV